MPVWLDVVVVVAVAAAILLAADRALLAAEARGWIRYRRRGVSRTSMGNAVMSVMQVYDPAARHAVDERLRYDTDEAEDDDDPFSDP